MRPGGKPVVDLALHGRHCRLRTTRSRAKILAGSPQRRNVPSSHRGGRDPRSGPSRRRDRLRWSGVVAGPAGPSVSASCTRALESRHREVRRAGADLRHARHLVHRDVIAVPVGLLIAIFLTELCPRWLRRPIGIAIELLAGIPSIIYGIWGLFVFAPFLQRMCSLLIDAFGRSRCCHAVRGAALRHRHAHRGPHPRDHGAALHHFDSRDVFETVPPVLKEAPTAWAAPPGK